MTPVNRLTPRPARIQRKRLKGWRMPTNTIYVGRGSQWGNPFVVGNDSGVFDGKEGRCLGMHDQAEILMPAITIEQSIELFTSWTHGVTSPEMYPHGHNSKNPGRNLIIAVLRGKNLACWCPLDSPCHADILLEIAN